MRSRSARRIVPATIAVRFAHEGMSHDGVPGRARKLDARPLGLVSLLLLALSQVCACGAPYRIEGTDMGPRFQNLRVSREGQPVNDATVTVNGVAIPRTGDGFHQGQLPANVPVGSPLALELRSGSDTVRGTGNVPEAPVLTAPATGTVFAPTDTITVRWTSATTPDRFVVNASWLEGETGTGRHYPAAATARSLEIPASELPAGPEVKLEVFAYNDGSFTGSVAPGSRMSIRGEDASKAVITVGDAGMELLIRGGDMGTQHQHLGIYQDGKLVTGAEVTVNGVPADPTSYFVLLPDPVPVGSPLHLEVRYGGVIVRGTGLVPETPGLTAPVTGSTFAPTDTITVSWTSATTPDRFMVIAEWREGDASTSKFLPAPADARSLDIPASELPSGREVTISVFAYSDGSFTGPVTPDSSMNIRGHDYVTKAVITIAP